MHSMNNFNAVPQTILESLFMTFEKSIDLYDYIQFNTTFHEYSKLHAIYDNSEPLLSQRTTVQDRGEGLYRNHYYGYYNINRCPRVLQFTVKMACNL